MRLEHSVCGTSEVAQDVLSLVIQEDVLHLTDKGTNSHLSPASTAISHLLHKHHQDNNQQLEKAGLPLKLQMLHNTEL